MIVGNPGLGKSMYQYYIIASLVNPALFGRRINTYPYKVIVRQVGNSHMIVMILETCEAFITFKVESELLHYLDKATTLYLFEPDLTKSQEPFNVMNMKLVGTVSPNDGRYKELMKIPGALMFYFPLWKKDELLTLADYIVSTCKLTKPLQTFYSREQTKLRYDEFSGVLRNVLPDSPEKLEDLRRLRDEALIKVSMGAGHIESKDVPHFVAKMIVPTTGCYAFRRFTLDIVSPFVMKRLEDEWKAVGLDVGPSHSFVNSQGPASNDAGEN